MNVEMELTTKHSNVVKVCVVGDSYVGKTSIAVRFVRDVFYSNLQPTLGVGYLTRCLQDENGKCHNYQIWDTAGQERYKSLVPIYYQEAAVVLIVYDVTNRDSFVSGAASWIKILKDSGPTSAVYVLVGNKADKENSSREVGAVEGRKKAEEIGALYFETSAKSGYNVCELFKNISMILNERSSKPCYSEFDSSPVGKTSSTNFSLFGRKLSSKFRWDSFKLTCFENGSSSDSSCCGEMC